MNDISMLSKIIVRVAAGLVVALWLSTALLIPFLTGYKLPEASIYPFFYEFVKKPLDKLGFYNEK